MRMIVEGVRLSWDFEASKLNSYIFQLTDSPGEQNISIVLNGIESELQFMKMGIENQVKHRH